MKGEEPARAGERGIGLAVGRHQTDRHRGEDSQHLVVGMHPVADSPVQADILVEAGSLPVAEGKRQVADNLLVAEGSHLAVDNPAELLQVACPMKM